MEEVGIRNRPLHPKKRKRNPSILLTTCAPFLGVECGQILLQLKRWCGNWVETVASPYWFDVFSKALVRHHACAVLRISINCHESVHFQDLKVFLEMWFKEPGAYDSARGFWIGRLPSAQGAQRFCGGRFYQEGMLIRCEEYFLSYVKEDSVVEDFIKKAGLLGVKNIFSQMWRRWTGRTISAVLLGFHEDGGFVAPQIYVEGCDLVNSHIGWLVKATAQSSMTWVLASTVHQNVEGVSRC